MEDKSLESKQEARWSDIIASEIEVIEGAIAQAVSERKFNVTVMDTTMTEVKGDCCDDCIDNSCPCIEDSDDYYRVWKQQLINYPCQDAMQQVIKYFEDRKYTISRKTNPKTNKSFMWIISWA